MSVYIEPQRPERPGKILTPAAPREWKDFLFIQYAHLVTPAEAGYFEWWSPYVNGKNHDVRVWYATLTMDILVKKPGIAHLYAQNADENIRCLIHACDCNFLLHRVPDPPFMLPVKSRGVVVLDSVAENTQLNISYLLEFI